MRKTNIQVGDKIEDKLTGDIYEIIDKEEKESFMSKGTKTYFTVKINGRREKERMADFFKKDRYLRK
ncbi:hypothetical protein SAMN05443574_103341 [Haloarcula vallismortis]|uniref:Uncharacterized protein n=2 Tax=Haloarcula vallismortis TaxID=28442 RepID=M0JTB7_HALVA|nr:hypothetical protein [Haloarcula vallismortis]EMA11603.1 hypothetical protein C437_01785 [Haloarcula vallismortis ATCC 29715]SDW46004.1 hypothetical protein SAMN05443574_103341 [Haloarcula vallismortis]